MSRGRNDTPLTKERLFRTALELVDREGLDALTMRRLGSELGVEAMSIYYHVPNKAAVLDGVAELALEELRLGYAEGDDWIEALKDGFRLARRILRSHPNLIPMLAVSPAADRGSRELAERVLGLMGQAGIPPTEAHRAFRVLQAFLFGQVMADAVRPTAEEIQAQGEELGRGEPDFPLLRVALSHPEQLLLERDFEFGVELILDGLLRWAEAG